MIINVTVEPIVIEGITTTKIVVLTPDSSIAANGLPVGGNIGQIPVKASTTDFHVNWMTAGTGIGVVIEIVAGEGIYVNSSDITKPIVSIIQPTTAKTAIVNNDIVMGFDSENTFSLIKYTWTSIKSFLKTYFDTVYNSIITATTNLSLNTVLFNTTPTLPTILTGLTYWDTVNKTISTVLENGVVLQHGQEIHIYGKNASGVKIFDGQAVSITQVGGSFITFQKTDITSDASAHGFVGIATQDFENNDFGYVTVYGLVRNINTAGMTEGAPLYVSATPGVLTQIYPTAPNHICKVGVVQYAHATNGAVLVVPEVVPKLSELSDVNGTALTTTGQFLVWNNTTKVHDFTENINDYAKKSGTKFGTDTDYTEFQSDGSLVMVGAATVFEDAQFPATAINPAGAPSPMTFDPDNISFLANASATQSIAIIAQMPHAWKIGSPIFPHIHWQPRTTNVGNAFWRLEYKWVNIGDVESGSWTTLDVLGSADGNVGKHLLTAWSSISGTGKTLSSMIKFKLSRIGGDVLDTYTGDALLLQFDFHYERDTLGSRQEYIK